VTGADAWEVVGGWLLPLVGFVMVLASVLIGFALMREIGR
jgi:hypothetical protein